MDLIYPLNLIPFLKDKYVLLDTNIFRDSVKKPGVFSHFFNTLKESGATLTTLDVVKYELHTGASSIEKYRQKEKHINDVVDTVLPIIPNIYELAYQLIQEYQIDGVGLSTTDLLLGATLMQYKNKICLMTRDTTDFIQRIFKLQFIVNAPHPKGIFTYGIYQYIR